MTEEPKRYLRSFLNNEGEGPFDYKKFRKMNESFQRTTEPLLESIRKAALMLKKISEQVTPELVDMIWEECLEEQKRRVLRILAGEAAESVSTVSFHAAICSSLQSKIETAPDAETAAHFQSMLAMTKACPEIVDLVLYKQQKAIREKIDARQRGKKKPPAAEPK